MYKEHKQIEEKFSLLRNNLDLVLQILEERKVEPNKYCQNSDYIKEEISLLRKKIESKRVATEQKEIKLQEEDFKVIIRHNNTILQLLTQIQENINIRCRFNSSEEHIWHSSHSQLNLLVDLVHNLYITFQFLCLSHLAFFPKLYKCYLLGLQANLIDYVNYDKYALLKN